VDVCLFAMMMNVCEKNKQKIDSLRESCQSDVTHYPNGILAKAFQPKKHDVPDVNNPKYALKKEIRQWIGILQGKKAVRQQDEMKWHYPVRFMISFISSFCCLWTFTKKQAVEQMLHVWHTKRNEERLSD